MNTYETQFFCKCPVNGVRILYELKISTTSVIPVEELLEHISANYSDGFHEKIADDLQIKFGGSQTMSANHHSVTIRTIRP